MAMSLASCTSALRSAGLGLSPLCNPSDPWLLLLLLLAAVDGKRPTKADLRARDPLPPELFRAPSESRQLPHRAMSAVRNNIRPSRRLDTGSDKSLALLVVQSPVSPPVFTFDCLVSEGALLDSNSKRLGLGGAIPRTTAAALPLAICAVRVPLLSPTGRTRNTLLLLSCLCGHNGTSRRAK